MSETSRRNFLAAAGVGAAGSAAALGMSGSAEAAPSRNQARQPVVAVVDIQKAGVVRLLVGEREIVLKDKDLANRILNAAGGN